MKKYTPEEIERLKRKYLNSFEIKQLELWGICSLFAQVYLEFSLNLALLIRAAEEEL